jgi:hypothetical protein
MKPFNPFTQSVARTVVFTTVAVAVLSGPALSCPEQAPSVTQQTEEAEGEEVASVAADDSPTIVSDVDSLIAEENSIRFRKLVSEWQRQKGATSSLTAMAACDAYLEIIGMGRSVAVPLIIAQLRAEGGKPDYWFRALRILTQASPVLPGHRGNFQKMAQDWITWADRAANAG